MTLAHQDEMTHAVMMLAGAVSFVVVVGGQAAAQPGTAQVAGRSVLAIKGCGRSVASFTAVVVTAPDGTWAAQEADGQHVSGTWLPKNARGRRLEVTFDEESEAAFVAALLGDVAELCDATGPITVTSVRRKIFTLTLNRKGTRAALVLRYAVRGRTEEGAGTARYRIKGKGPWTPAAVPSAERR